MLGFEVPAARKMLTSCSESGQGSGALGYRRRGTEKRICPAWGRFRPDLCLQLPAGEHGEDGARLVLEVHENGRQQAQHQKFTLNKSWVVFNCEAGEVLKQIGQKGC